MKFSTISAADRAVELEETDQLKYTKVKIVKMRPNEYCQQYSSSAKLQGKNIICAGNSDTNHRDACKGDSGGPLACVQNNTMILTGIVSHGNVCGGEKFFPGFYTRVKYYLDWINQYKVSVNLLLERCLMVLRHFQETKPYSPLNCWLISKKGNNLCDDRNNFIGCEWDGGDCCTDKKQWDCSQCECLDPTHPNFGKSKPWEFV